MHTSTHWVNLNPIATFIALFGSLPSKPPRNNICVFICLNSRLSSAVTQYVCVHVKTSILLFKRYIIWLKSAKNWRWCTSSNRPRNVITNLFSQAWKLAVVFQLPSTGVLPVVNQSSNASCIFGKWWNHVSCIHAFILPINESWWLINLASDSFRAWGAYLNLFAGNGENHWETPSVYTVYLWAAKIKPLWSIRIKNYLYKW